jgi:hypothetical protein
MSIVIMAAQLDRFSVLDTFQFSEWIAYNYIRLHACWIHKYDDQRNKDNFKETGELFKFWMDNIKNKKS